MNPEPTLVQFTDSSISLLSDKFSGTSESESESDIVEMNCVDYSPTPPEGYSNHVNHLSENSSGEEMMEDGVRYEPPVGLIHANNDKNHAAAWEQNSRVRVLVVKEVKRPGKSKLRNYWFSSSPNYSEVCL